MDHRTPDMPSLYTEISQLLIKWYDAYHRDLPWRNTHDAYRIWISEIILQQTRVSQGLDYYLRFVEAFPSVDQLANAPIDQVMKLWQGLGYYSRARNLHAAAQQVMETLGGQFPTNYAQLLTLKGVGPYTAAAIASFAANEKVACIDGNVYRVLSRIFDIDTPFDSTPGKRLFAELADQLLPTKRCDTHNQAMMEFGALCCTPQSPLCDQCPLGHLCQSRANGTTDLRPIKQQKVKVRSRFLHYIVLLSGDTIFVRKRPSGDIWEGLYEFIMVEKPQASPIEQILPEVMHSAIDWTDWTITPLLENYKHQLTHQSLTISCHLVQSKRPIRESDINGDYFAISVQKWVQFAVSKPITEANNKLFRILSCNSQNNS